MGIKTLYYTRVRQLALAGTEIAGVGLHGAASAKAALPEPAAPEPLSAETLLTADGELEECESCML